MYRRRALVSIAGGLLGASAGCALPGSGVSPRALPDRPDDLDARSAVEYAVEYEEAHGYNERIEGRDDLVGFSYGCDGALETATDDAYYVSVQCGFSETSERDGDRAAGEGVTDPILYLVSTDDLVRAPTVGVRVETEPGDAVPHGIRLANLSGEDRVVGLEVRFGTGGDGEREAWFADAFELRAGSGYTLERLTGPSGVYTVAVEPDDGPNQTRRWEVPGPEGPDVERGWSGTNVNLGVYVTPSGDVRTFELRAGNA